MSKLIEFLRCPYWKDRDLYLLNISEEFEDIEKIVLDVIKRMPDNLVFVCGPILPNLSDKNRRKREKRIRKYCLAYLRKEGLIPFDYSYILKTTERLAKKWIEDGLGYCRPVIDIYLQIISEEKIKKVYFLPSWKESDGATFIKLEVSSETKYKVEVLDFPQEKYEEILKELKIPTNEEVAS